MRNKFSRVASVRMVFHHILGRNMLGILRRRHHKDRLSVCPDGSLSIWSTNRSIMRRAGPRVVEMELR